MSSTKAKIYDPLTAAEVVRITDIEVLRTPVMRVSFSDGETREIDFSDVIERSRWFRTLAVPTTFSEVEIVHNGRALQWITGADFCADALRIKGDRQAAE